MNYTTVLKKATPMFPEISSVPRLQKPLSRNSLRYRTDETYRERVKHTAREFKRAKRQAK